MSVAEMNPHHPLILLQLNRAANRILSDKLLVDRIAIHAETLVHLLLDAVKDLLINFPRNRLSPLLKAETERVACLL